MSQPLIRPKTRREIAAELQISYRTLNRKLTTAKIQIPSGLVYPADQIKIYELIFWPKGIHKGAFELYLTQS